MYGQGYPTVQGWVFDLNATALLTLLRSAMPSHSGQIPSPGRSGTPGRTYV